MGWTREAIVAQLGEPESVWDGHFGLHNMDRGATFEPCKSMRYRKWGGTLYISVYEVDGQWRCFTSDWLAPGSVY